VISTFNVKSKKNNYPGYFSLPFPTTRASTSPRFNEDTRQRVAAGYLTAVLAWGPNFDCCGTYASA